jgi:hypothetical protein
MADWFVAQFLDEWEAHRKESDVPKYNKKCLEHEFATTDALRLQCRGPAYPGDVKCHLADRLMNQLHNEVRARQNVIVPVRVHTRRILLPGGFLKPPGVW